MGGTLAGGLLLDHMGSSLRNALLVCAAGLACGGVLVVAAFSLTTSFPAFCLVLAAGEVFMFSSAAPSNAVVMWSVPAGLRPFATSISVVAMHLLGDVPSPPLLGWTQQRLENWRLTMSVYSLLLLAGAAAYATGVLYSRTATDYRTVADPGSDGGEEEAADEAAAGGREAQLEDSTALLGLRMGPLSHEDLF